jgi:hypothetical protein
MYFFYQGTKEANPKQIRDIIAMQIGQPINRTSATSTPLPHPPAGAQHQQQPLVNGVHGGGPHHGPPGPLPAGMPPMAQQQFRGPHPMSAGGMPHLPGQMTPQAMHAAAGGVAANPTAQNVHNKFLQVNKIIYF